MKTILVDFTRLAEKCGFGEIADNYSKNLVTLPKIKDMRFVFLVKEKDKGVMGDSVDYVSVEHLNHDLKQLHTPIDLWHTTDQLYIKRKHKKGMKNVFTVHDLNFLHEKKGIHRIKTLWKLKWHVKRSDCVTVISNYVKEDLLAHVNIGKKPLHVIYNGIKDTETELQKKPAFITNNQPFFFTIGQTRAKKNFHVLIPMMKSLPEYKLYICGKPYSSYYYRLKSLIQECGIDNVILTGEISNQEKNWMYAHCAAFLFPSLLEGFGLPVLEAMRFKAKVFSSRFTSLPEVCKDHATYFDSYVPEDMANLVREETCKWDKNSEEAEKAKEYSETFTYDKYTSTYINLYRQLIGLGKLDL